LSDIDSEFPDVGPTAVHDLTAIRDQLRSGRGVSDRHLLVRMSGSSVGQVVGLEDSGVILGRSPDSHVWVHDDDVSRKHARVERDGGGYAVVDLASANGTFVNGERVTKHMLTDGDVVQIGPHVSFRYCLTDGDHEQMLRSLYEATVHDALTGAFNREHLDERLRAEVSFAKRHHTEVSLVMLDLDRFKSINDNYGHPKGDEVLVAVTQALRETLRLEDMLARYGGEEFAVVLRNIPLLGAARLAERLRVVVAAVAIAADGRVIRPTASFGCASLACCDDPSVEQLVSLADQRLFEAKRRGRNCVVAEG
jgi:diguanylate cyclase (GGDEF)-like protein